MFVFSADKFNALVLRCHVGCDVSYRSEEAYGMVWSKAGFQFPVIVYIGIVVTCDLMFYVK